MSWREGTVNNNAPIYDRHGMPTFKKRSTFLATSVANLDLVMGDGLRLQSFVLICNDGQTGLQKMGGYKNLLGPWWAIVELQVGNVNLTRSHAELKSHL